MYEVKSEHIARYGEATSHVADFLDSERHGLLLCPLRGALPPTRVILSLLNQQSRYKPPTQFVVTTSYVERREELIDEGLKKALQTGSSRWVTLDCCITGSALRYYQNRIKTKLPKLMEHLDFPEVQYDIIGFWDKPGLDRKGMVYVGEWRNDASDRVSVVLRRWNLFIPELYCEDVPDLLGIDYFEPAGKDRFSAKLRKTTGREPVSVKTDGKVEEHSPIAGENSADLFVRLVLGQIASQHVYTGNIPNLDGIVKEL